MFRSRDSLFFPPQLEMLILVVQQKPSHLWTDMGFSALFCEHSCGLSLFQRSTRHRDNFINLILILSFTDNVFCCAKTYSAKIMTLSQQVKIILIKRIFAPWLKIRKQTVSSLIIDHVLANFYLHPLPYCCWNIKKFVGISTDSWNNVKFVIEHEYSWDPVPVFRMSFQPSVSSEHQHTQPSSVGVFFCDEKVKYYLIFTS